MRDLKSKLTGMRELMLLLIVIIVFVAMSLISPYFFTSANLMSVLLTLSIEAILVVGMVNLLISGGFDMSIGSVIGLSGGEGSVLGGFLGCILMAIITNSMTLLNVSVYWQTFVTGFTLFLAVLIDCISKRKQTVQK